jgi:hypothetical protein
MEREPGRAIALALLVAGCATTGAAVADTATAKDDAIACAADVLAWRGYDVWKEGESSDSLVAEMRLAYPAGAAVREIITTSVDRSAAPAELRVSVRAWSHQPAQHSVPTARQSISEVPPSGDAVTDAQLVLATCGLTRGESHPLRNTPTRGDR